MKIDLNMGNEEITSCNGSSKRKGEEGDVGTDGRRRQKQNVTMVMEVLDCPVCSKPLSPPIYQCSVGHVVCWSCCEGLPEKSRRDVETSSLADGLPTKCFCVLPKVAGDKTEAVVLWITMDTIFPIHDDELYEEDDDDDDSYEDGENEDEEDDD
uniref:Putative E3 ubiquitin-protein ligase SINA-like protein 9 n=1 Tax=Aegilops tauschii TaxID=37682 RepID=N1R215_AEGTA